MITVPTKEEVDARHNDRARGDPSRFEADEYIPYMSLDGMRQLVKEGTTEEVLERLQLTLTSEEMIADMEKYMPFAFEKAHDQRGISANRSIQHYIAWTWLAGDNDLSAEVERMYEKEYHNWGLPILRKICEFYGFNPVRAED